MLEIIANERKESAGSHRACHIRKLIHSPSATVSTISPTSRITFVVAVNDRGLFERNFLASPCLTKLQHHQILVQENFNSAAKAYNDAIEHSWHDLLVFCHQDVILPKSWPSELERALNHLEAADPNWGVLGCSGTTVIVSIRDTCTLPDSALAANHWHAPNLYRRSMSSCLS